MEDKLTQIQFAELRKKLSTMSITAVKDALARLSCVAGWRLESPLNADTDIPTILSGEEI